MAESEPSSQPSKNALKKAAKEAEKAKKKAEKSAREQQNLELRQKEAVDDFLLKTTVKETISIRKLPSINGSSFAISKSTKTKNVSSGLP